MTIKKDKKTETSYRLIFDQGVNENGKQIRKVMGGFESREEAKNFLNSIGKGALIIEKVTKTLHEPKTSNKPKTWSDLEVKKFLELAKVTDNGLSFLYEVTLAAGLRLGEVAGLSWSDVNFHEKTLTVNNTTTGLDINLILKPVYHKRTISLPEQIIIKLAAHKKQQEQLKFELGKNYQNKHNLVFTNKSGGVINPNLVQAQFRNLNNKANVRKITFHGLRHTHARSLIQKGVSLDIVSDRLGNQDIQLTRDTYSHFLNTNNKD